MILYFHYLMFLLLYILLLFNFIHFYVGIFLNQLLRFSANTLASNWVPAIREKYEMNNE